VTTLVAEVATRAVPSLSRAFAAVLGVALPAWSALERSGAHSEDEVATALAELRVCVERGTNALLEACRQLTDVAQRAGRVDARLTDAVDAARALLADVVRESTVFVVPPPQVTMHCAWRRLHALLSSSPARTLLLSTLRFSRQPTSFTVL
jgi:hypothetical protein